MTNEISQCCHPGLADGYHPEVTHKQKTASERETSTEASKDNEEFLLSFYNLRFLRCLLESRPGVLWSFGLRH
jgi:hypothetical protein